MQKKESEREYHGPHFKEIQMREPDPKVARKD